jgi:hypothetical protein
MEIGKLVAICFNGLTNALRQSLRPSRTELDAPAALIMAGLAAQWKSGDRVQPRLQTLQPALGALLPDIIEAVVFSPCDLVEDFAVKPVGGLAPLRWVAEVVPKTKAYLSAVVTHDLPL